jgi:ribosomal-protein-alanine N-acetyltransferase
MLADKHREERESAARAAAEREKELAKAEAERKKQFDGPIDCYRVILRHWEKKDAKDFDEYVERLYSTHTEHCVHSIRHKGQPKLADYLNDKTKWAVEFKENGKVIGGFALDFIDGQDKNKVREITHVMDEQHTGGGYTTEATRGLVNFGFEILGLSTIHFSLCETNKGGLKVANASGFKFDSVSTHKEVCKFDSKLHSTKDFSITAGEWQAFKTEHKIK